MTTNSHAAGVSRPLCLDGEAANAGAVEPRGNAACEADDTPMTPDEIRQNLAEMYRLAYALRIPTP